MELRFRKRPGAIALLSAACCVMAAPPLGAQATPGKPEPYSAAYGRCTEASGGVTAALLDCGAAEYARLDALLNVAYRKANAGLSPPQKTLLRDSQRAWLANRDATCSLMSRLGDRGTMALLVDQQCLLEQTAARTQWLEGIEQY